MGATSEAQYPHTDRAELVDTDMVRDYLDTLFAGVSGYKPHHFINVRGIGEKGTDREGAFQEDCWAQPGVVLKGEDPDELLAGDVTGWTRLWAQHNVATYIVPAVLKEARGSSAAVELFTSVLVDLDTGDTGAKATYLGAWLGTPSIVVRSGGVTDVGTPKLHLYWVFDTPCADVGRVVDLRHELAVKIGGDLQFGRGVADNPYGRAHQPIRIPGTVHAKGDNPRLVELRHADPAQLYEIDVLAEALRRMPASPWAIQTAQPVAGVLGFDCFGPTINHRPDIAHVLDTPVAEGGEDRTRWSEFNRVAGHYLMQVRQGEKTLAEARELVHGWALVNMQPAWPEARIDKEFRALTAVEERKGPLPAEAVNGVTTLAGKRELIDWHVSNWIKPDMPIPSRKFVVDGLVLAGKPHLLVAEGGAGKTFAMLDLCLKVASMEGDEGAEQLEWLGQPIVAEPGGTVVMLTTEDDADELHIRIAEIDPGLGRVTAAGKRLIVIPAVNTEPGPFAFAERDRVTGAVAPGRHYRELLDFLERLPDLRLVVVDTFNTTMHGEENSATTVNEYARMLAPITRKGAAVIVTHHIRKPDAKFPLESAADMLAAVRGSSALPAAFRAVLGLWAHPGYEKVLPTLGETVRAKALWNLAVVKANNPQMVSGVRQLLRGDNGVMVDVSDRVRDGRQNGNAARKQWLALAVQLAAEAGAPFKHTKKDGRGGVYQRRQQLPPDLREGARQLDELVEAMIDSGELVVCDVDWMDSNRKARRWPTLDVADGSIASQTHNVIVNDAAVWTPDWNGWAFDASMGQVRQKGGPVMVL